MRKIVVYFFVAGLLNGCAFLKDASYQAPSGEEAATFFVYTPDLVHKSSEAFFVYIDGKRAGYIAENRPLQFSAAEGWHQLTIFRKTSLGPRDEQATVKVFTDKNSYYYVRFTKAPARRLEVVDEDTGRQMR